MATGDQNDFLARLKSNTPPWFGDWASAPLVIAVFTGMAVALAQVFSVQSYVRLQTRIKTATDMFLDLIALDFFGGRVLRGTQNDGQFRATIIRELFRERATRHAVSQVLIDLTGRAPIIIEPTQPGDTGAYGVPGSGYGVAGYYGSMLLPYQCFVIAFRPNTITGQPGSAGYGNAGLAYGAQPGGANASQWADPNNVFSNAPDSAIYAAIDSVKPEGTTIWTHIQS